MLIFKDLDHEMFTKLRCFLYPPKIDKYLKFCMGLISPHLKTDGCSIGRAVVKGETCKNPKEVCSHDF